MGLNGSNSQIIWTPPYQPCHGLPRILSAITKVLFLWDLEAPQLPTRTIICCCWPSEGQGWAFRPVQSRLGQGCGREGAGGDTNEMKQDSPDSSSLTAARFADSCRSWLTGPEAASLPPRAVETRRRGSAGDNCGHHSPQTESDRALSCRVSLVLFPDPVRVLSPFYRWGHLDILN